jgi:autotransporter-associated beta strand protein
LSGANAYSGATTVNAGTLKAGASNTFASGSAFTVGPSGTLDLNGFSQSIGSLAGSGVVTLGAGTLTTGNDNTSTIFSGSMSGTGGLTKVGTGTFTLSAPVTYSGATNVNAGTLQAGNANVFAPNSAFTVASGATLDLNGLDQSIASLAGAGSVTLGAGTLTAGSDNTNTTFSGDISGGGGLTKVGSGALTLSGTSLYIGATNINAGTLVVDGSIAASPFFVNSGGTLGGSGTVGTTTVASGGTLAPGTPIGTLSVNGTLAFNPGSTYAIDVSPAAADKVAVSGTASLAGTAQATFQGGSYAPKVYTILSSTGLGGTTFDTFTVVGKPSGFSASLDYTSTNALLILSSALGQDTTLNRNQQNVASAINSFFNGGGALPPEFLAIFNLGGTDLQGALSQLSGEAATGASRSASLMTGQFLGLMLDAFVDGRSANAFGGNRMAFAEDGALPNSALGYGAAHPQSPRLEPSFDRRWSTWATGFGGAGGFGGNASIGSHDMSMSTYGVAVGLDYRFSPDTVAGIAVAGGGTSWGLPLGLGGGTSDAFLVGAYAATRSGPAYLGTSIAFANHWVSTNRIGVNGDRLNGNFVGQDIGGRIEGGYRFGDIAGGVTPYAAVQAQVFQAPAYSETDTDNGPFALRYNAKDSNDTRTELGGRFDTTQQVSPISALTLRSRVAWVHDWVSNPSLNPVFQALPGASFTVTGAAPAKDLVLASAGLDLALTSGVTLSGKFDGEFGKDTKIFSGTASLRYRW